MLDMIDYLWKLIEQKQNRIDTLTGENEDLKRQLHDGTPGSQPSQYDPNEIERINNELGTLKQSYQALLAEYELYKKTHPDGSGTGDISKAEWDKLVAKNADLVSENAQ